MNKHTDGKTLSLPSTQQHPTYPNIGILILYSKLIRAIKFHVRVSVNIESFRDKATHHIRSLRSKHMNNLL